MVRPDISDSSTKQVHLKSRKHVDIWNKLRTSGVNLSEIVCNALEEYYEKKYRQQHQQQEPIIKESQLEQLQKRHELSNQGYFLNPKHGDHQSKAITIFKEQGREAMILHYKTTGEIEDENCPDCALEYQYLTLEEQPEEPQEEEQQLLQKQKQKQEPTPKPPGEMHTFIHVQN
jgi:hypothetical protein